MRTKLATFPIADAAHAGHALAYLVPPKQGGEGPGEDAANQLRSNLEAVTSIPVPEAYAAAYERFLAAATDLGAFTFFAAARGPLAIGLGNASAYEAGITLHRTYGVPYLPASALKGLAYRAAFKNGLARADLDELFGNQTQAGCVTFLDGWLVRPVSDRSPTLQLDIVTVHHPSYYGGGKEWPTDFDDPNPSLFLSVPPGTNFLVCTAGESSWAELAAKLVVWGLTYLGLGGKTNAGYGGLDCSAPELALTPAAKAEKEQEAAWQKRFDQEYKDLEKSVANIKPKLKGHLEKWKDFPENMRILLKDRLLQLLKTDRRTSGDKKLIKYVEKELENI